MAEVTSKPQSSQLASSILLICFWFLLKSQKGQHLHPHHANSMPQKFDEFFPPPTEKFSSDGENTGLSGKLPKLFGFNNNLPRYIEASFSLSSKFTLLNLKRAEIHQGFLNSKKENQNILGYILYPI